jgi:inward rectifier potassium channel
MIPDTWQQSCIFAYMAKTFFSLKQKFNAVDDLGWSSTVEEAEGRVLNKNGKFNLIRKGEQYNIYHLMISMTWPQFILLIFTAFTLVNGTFALLYYIVGSENLAGFVSKGFILDFINLFHFSVQTMTTVGYGAMYPAGIIISVLASVEALVGLMSFALISGLMYGRFSNPKAEIKYAKKMLLTKVKGLPTLQARIANKVSHDLFDIRARILMLHDEAKSDGTKIKHYRTLKLQIDNISFLPMNWTITHFIDEESPLHGMTKEDFKIQGIEFLVLITAFDDSFSQLVHSRSSYTVDELLFNEQWAKTYYLNEAGQRVFDLDRLDILKDRNVQE